MAGISTLNRVNYSGFDFDTANDELLAQLQIQFASIFNDFAISSLGIVLLDAVSFAQDTLAFYLDRRATDTYLQTARSRRSVALLTRQLGYKMAGAVASSVDLTVSAAQLYAVPIPISKGFQFKGPGAIVYEAAQSVTIPANSLAPVSIPAYQGQTISESFVSDGTANQRFTLSKVPSGSSVVQGTVQATVNGGTWSEVEFITFDATDQFEIGYNDDPPTIRFGDGTAGNIPVRNGAIDVSYVATLGASGKCVSGTITAPITPPVILGQTINLLVNNPAASIGGSDLEDLDHAKTYAPRVFKSRRVAVTRSDYEALAGSFVDPLFGRVAVAQAICPRSAENDLELKNLLADIAAQLDQATTTIAAAANDGLSRMDTSTAAATNLSADITALATQLTTLNTNLTSVQTSARTIKSNASEAAVDYSDAHTNDLAAKATLTALRASIAALPLGTPSQLTTADQASFLSSLDTTLNNLNKIDSMLGLINGLLSSISASTDSQTTVLDSTLQSLLNTIGVSVSTAGTLLNDISTQLSTISTQIGTATVPYSGAYADLHGILDAANLNTAAITADTAAIFDHVDKFLAADCESNLVVVPILARDASGFYAAPSNGLIRTLQSYLEGIKEVTQTVKVTSGADFLVPAAIRARIGIRVGISDTVTQASAETIIDGVLRDRAFGDSLYLSDLIDPLRLISGVVFVNVSILGYRPVGSAYILTDLNDFDGNLIVDDSRVITLSESDLTVTVEYFTGT